MKTNLFLLLTLIASVSFAADDIPQRPPHDLTNVQQCPWKKIPEHLKGIGGPPKAELSPEESLTIARQTANVAEREEFLKADREYRAALTAVKVAEQGRDSTLGDLAFNKERLRVAKENLDKLRARTPEHPVTRAYDPRVWVATAKHPELPKKIEELAQASSKLAAEEAKATDAYNAAKAAYEKAYNERLKDHPNEITGSKEFRDLLLAQEALSTITHKHDQIQEELGWLRFCRDIGPRIENGEVEVVSVVSQETFHKARGDQDSGVQEWGERFPVVMIRVTGKNEVSAVRTWSETIDPTAPDQAGQLGGYMVLQEPVGQMEKYAASGTLKQKLATPDSNDFSNGHNRATRYALPPGSVVAVGITGPVRPTARLIPGTEGFAQPLTDLTGPVYAPNRKGEWQQYRSANRSGAEGGAGGAGGRQQIALISDGFKVPAGSSPIHPDGYAITGSPRLNPERDTVRQLVLPNLPDQRTLPDPVRRAFIDEFSPEVKKTFDLLYALNPNYRQLSHDPALSNWNPATYPAAAKTAYETLKAKHIELTRKTQQFILDPKNNIPKPKQIEMLIALRHDVDAHWSELIHIAPPDVRNNPPTPDQLHKEIHDSLRDLGALTVRAANSGGI